MENRTQQIGQQFVPVKALLIYESINPKNDTYVESYEVNEFGYPTNGRPLTLKECGELSRQLSMMDGVSNSFLKSKGLIPDNLLFLNPTLNGYAVWYTDRREHSLHFTESLAIPSGKCDIPPLIWKASRDKLWLYAWERAGRPVLEMELLKAPFFNVYSDGLVCMGTVRRSQHTDKGLEDFINKWMEYFFNSYFSHALGASPTKTNIVNLWKELSGSGKPFPMNVLNQTNTKLKDIIG